MTEEVHYRIEDEGYFKLFIFNLAISILFMGTFVFNQHLSVDDYWLYYRQETGAMTDIQQNMRIFSGGAGYLLDALGINIVSHQLFFGILLILTYAWASTRISIEIISVLEVHENLGKIAFINGATLILFFNASVSEILYYSGAYVQWIIGILGFTYGAICISRKVKVSLNVVVGLAALTITAGSYQTFLSQYIYIAMALIYIRNDGRINKKSVLEVVRAVIAAGMAMAINILGCGLLVSVGIIAKGSRMAFEWSKMSQIMKDIVRSQWDIWVKGIGIYPTGLLAMALFLIVGILIMAIIKKNARVDEIIFLAAVLASGFLVVYMAQIIQGYIRVTNRGMYAVFGLYTVGLWIICYYLKDNSWKNIRRLGSYLICAFLIYSCIEINRVAVDVMKTNTLSKCYIEEISRRIASYENQNNIRITKMGFCRDASVNYRYYDYIETGAYGDMCANTFLGEWSGLSSIKYYSDREFERVSVPDDIQAYCAEINWDEADWDHQLFFDKEAVYICLF